MRGSAVRHAVFLLLTASCAAGCGSHSTRPTPPVSCQYSLDPSTLQPCMRATQATIGVTTDAGCAWTATAGASWIRIDGGSTGKGNGIVTVSVSDNWSPPRLGVVTIRRPGSSTGQDVRVAQAGCYYSVTQDAFTFAPAGGSGSFDVYQMADPNTCGGALQNACVWSAQSDSPWIAISTSMPTSGDQTVRFTVERNTTGAARTGTIAVRDKAVRVTQSAT